jgi:multidrug efflux pump subunit AcrA (membrane-fusion protein)
MVMQAQAGARLAQVMREEAALTLSRMEIRSPASGVVMTRLVEPGARLSMLAASYGGAPQGSAGAVEVMGAVVRLYDPLMLQVRVDVPLGDAGKVGPGTQARITTEALPGKTFAGRVTRAVHEANIQRNTVQLKVAIDEPDPVLRPEMLARVRFLADARPGSDSRSAAGDGTSHAEDVRLLIPRSAVLEANDGAGRVWLADQAGGTRGPVAARRPISFVAAPEDGFVEVVEGLRPGDRVVIDPAPRLVEGARLKMIEDATGGGP